MNRKLLLVPVFAGMLLSCREPGSNYQPTTVSAWRVQAGSAAAIRIDGTISPSNETDLRAPFDGILRWEMGSGRPIRRGDVVATVVSKELEARRAAAKNSLTFASDTCRQQKLAYDSGLIAADQLRIYEESLAEAESALELIEIQLARAAVRTPVDGMMVWKADLPDGGEVSSGESLCRVARTDLWRFAGACSRDEWKLAEKAPEWSLDLNDGSRSVKAVLESGIADPNVPGKVAISAVFSPSPATVPGSRAALCAEGLTSVAAIPVECIVYVNRRPHVYVIVKQRGFIERGRIELRSITVGATSSDRASVYAGLAPDDLVVWSNLDNMAADSWVRFEVRE